MSLRYLIDTNLLVYLHDPRDPAKRARAGAVLEHLAAAQSAALPAQVLAEFASVTLKKLKPPLAPDAVYAQLQRFSDSFPVLPLTSAVVLEAARGVRDHQLSYYDAQIWAVAKLARVGAILSEDFNVGAVIDGVAFLDPFVPTFAVADLG
jgi:predicted nucleic acid-binding protein